MLTRGDLHQIELLFDRKFDEKFDEKFDKSFDKKFDEKIKPIYAELAKHTRILNSHSRALKSLKKDQGIMLDLLDREQMSIRKRLELIEQRLGSSSSVA